MAGQRGHGTGWHSAACVEGRERDTPDRTTTRSLRLRHWQADRMDWAARSLPLAAGPVAIATVVAPSETDAVEILDY